MLDLNDSVFITPILLELRDALNPIVNEKMLLEPRVKIFLEIPIGNFKVLANRVEFERVISNVLDNSVFALSSVIIPQITIKVVRVDRFIRIEIADNGTDISSNIINLIGKVRITTKTSTFTDNTSGGSGIGLLHAKRVIERMSGKFEIASSDGNGTIVSVFLLIAN